MLCVKEEPRGEDPPREEPRREVPRKEVPRREETPEKEVEDVMISSVKEETRVQEHEIRGVLLSVIRVFKEGEWLTAPHMVFRLRDAEVTQEMISNCFGNGTKGSFLGLFLRSFPNIFEPGIVWELSELAELVSRGEILCPNNIYPPLPLLRFRVVSEVQCSPVLFVSKLSNVSLLPIPRSCFLCKQNGRTWVGHPEQQCTHREQSVSRYTSGLPIDPAIVKRKRNLQKEWEEFDTLKRKREGELATTIDALAEKQSVAMDCNNHARRMKQQSRPKGGKGKNKGKGKNRKGDQQGQRTGRDTHQRMPLFPS